MKPRITQPLCRICGFAGNMNYLKSTTRSSKQLLTHRFLNYYFTE